MKNNNQELISQNDGYEEELYKQKYLKYKLKYTELKAQIGGDELENLLKEIKISCKYIFDHSDYLVASRGAYFTDTLRQNIKEVIKLYTEKGVKHIFDELIKADCTALTLSSIITKEKSTPGNFGPSEIKFPLTIREIYKIGFRTAAGSGATENDLKIFHRIREKYYKIPNSTSEFVIEGDLLNDIEYFKSEIEKIYAKPPVISITDDEKNELRAYIFFILYFKKNQTWNYLKDVLTIQNLNRLKNDIFSFQTIVDMGVPFDNFKSEIGKKYAKSPDNGITDDEIRDYIFFILNSKKKDTWNYLNTVMTIQNLIGLKSDKISYKYNRFSYLTIVEMGVPFDNFKSEIGKKYAKSPDNGITDDEIRDYIFFILNSKKKETWNYLKDVLTIYNLNRLKNDKFPYTTIADMGVTYEWMRENVKTEADLQGLSELSEVLMPSFCRSAYVQFEEKYKPDKKKELIRNMQIKDTIDLFKKHKDTYSSFNSEYITGNPSVVNIKYVDNPKLVKEILFPWIKS